MGHGLASFRFLSDHQWQSNLLGDLWWCQSLFLLWNKSYQDLPDRTFERRLLFPNLQFWMTVWGRVSRAARLHEACSVRYLNQSTICSTRRGHQSFRKTDTSTTGRIAAAGMKSRRAALTRSAHCFDNAGLYHCMYYFWKSCIALFDPFAGES